MFEFLDVLFRDELVSTAMAYEYFALYTPFSGWYTFQATMETHHTLEGQSLLGVPLDVLLEELDLAQDGEVIEEPDLATSGYCNACSGKPVTF